METFTEFRITSRSRSWTLLFVAVVIGLSTVSAQVPQCIRRINSCSCETDKGVIDLSPLDTKNPSSPKFVDIPSPTNQNQKFAYNPCSAFTQGTGVNCMNVAVCETLTNFQWCAGTQDSSTFDSSGTDLAIRYSGCTTGGSSTSVVNLVCDPQTEGKLESISTGITMTFRLTSKYACPGKHGGGGGGGGGISVGTVLCIIAIVVVVLYLLVGMAFMRFARNASGIEIIPNVAFWRDLPSLVKDGASFVVSPATRKAGYTEY